jgi:hypothetical protein
VCRYDFYEKAVTFKPYQVDMLDPVTANFLGDNLRCWMQIQVLETGSLSDSSYPHTDIYSYTHRDSSISYTHTGR